MKYKLFRSPGDLDKAVRKHELVAVETGKNIDDVVDALIRAVRDDLAEMPEYAHCETAAYAPEPVQEHRRVRRYQYEMMGIVYPQYAEKNILIDYGVMRGRVMSERDVGQLHSADDLIAAVEQYGFLPFFRNEIHGFSIEELCPPELWFADDVDGPWEWKGPAARSGKCLYGKLFNKKAGFVSREWIPDFANFRRDGYDFDARWDDGLASYKDKELYESIAGEGRMLSKRLKEALNYRKGGNTGFETCITRLQMQSYVCIADFVYMQDRYGRPYGWGVAEYATPEELFGYDLITSAYQRDPQESKERMMQHLSSILPGASVQQLTKILKG